MSITIYQHLRQLLDQGHTVAVATIVDVRGSVPREVGAKMIIHPLGRHAGTVGGGCGEADVIRAGLDVIQDGVARNVGVDLTDAISMESLGVCGGVMTVFIEQWRPENAVQQAALAAILAGADARESVAVITVTASDGETGQDWIGRRAVLTVAGATAGDLSPAALPAAFDAARQALDLREHQTIATGSDPAPLTLFIEVLAQPPHLIIAGAGHIAVPLAQIAKINDFEVTVLDDRPQYAHTARFPTADRVIAGPFRSELQRLRGDRPRFDAHTYLVLVTRGHQHDVDCLLEVLDDPVAYIGMIGSQRRIRAVFELLEQEQGIPPEKFDGVYAPVGIDIGAHTPAEIAVCIMAEIINLQRRGPAESLSDKIRRERQERRERVKPA